MSDDDRVEENENPGEAAAENFEAEVDAAAVAVGGPRLAPEEAIADAHDDRLRAKASWSLVDRELLTFLFANCLFFAGALASWTSRVPGQPVDVTQEVTGLHTIRGALIFAIAIYGFWTAIFNIWHRQTKIKPYLWNALLALWVGIQGILTNTSGEKWKATIEALKQKQGKSLMDDILYRLGVVPPGMWLLTIGGALVMVLLVRGILAGSQKAKARAAESGTGSAGRRRR